jgi:hypothetical protein
MVLPQRFLSQWNPEARQDSAKNKRKNLWGPFWETIWDEVSKLQRLVGHSSVENSLLGEKRWRG